MKEAKNNSYETEPSSSSSLGSGNSLSCANNDDLEIADVGKIKLPILLEPRNYDYDRSVELDDDIKSCKKGSTPSSAYKSSQESPFAGFRETPLKQLQEQRFFYEDTSDLEGETNGNDDDVVYVKTFQHISGEAAKKAIYDTVVGENSCNAVDMPLTSQEYEHSSEKERAAELNSQVSDLSFNGKIKALDLNCSKDENPLPQNTETDENKTLDLNGSSFSKYGMSPDLFADDDDDDENDDDDDTGNLTVEPEAKATVGNVDSVAKNLKQAAPSKNEQIDTSANRSLNCPTESSYADELTLDCTIQNENNIQKLYRENCNREKDLLRRIRKCLSGVPPPPSLTIPQMDLIQMVLDCKMDILNFFKDSNLANNEETSKINQRTSLFKPTHTLDEARNMPWRDILGVRQHGFCYNLSTASEHCEYLSLSVVERFVGAETTSSYRRSPSSAKKRNLRVKLLPQSPGNRLSHLAKRRAIFSSANLATTSQRSATALGPQIVIDKKKTKNRRKATPKRKTPGSKKKTRKTPSSSARKLQFRSDLNKPAPTRETSKRALFQSPMDMQQQQQTRLTKPQIKPEIATKVEKSKRALFSPDTTTTTTTQIEKPTTSAAAQRSETMLFKRKRNENDDGDNDDDVEGLGMPSKKLLRCDASSLTPRALKIKSQSFCIGAGSSDVVANKTTLTATLKSVKRNLLGCTSSSNNSFQSLSSAGSSSSLNYASHGGSTGSFFTDKKLQRAQSDMVATSVSLTDNQKKKLLWAVSQALQEKKISTQHENFKQHASVLARVVRRIFQEFYQRTSTSNSETLLRLAKKYVFYVISGRSCDDIYMQVRAEENKRLSTSRLTGYIGPEEYQQRKLQQQLSQQLSQSSFISSFSSSICGSLQNLMSIDDTCSQPPTQATQQTFESNTNSTNFSSLWSTKSVAGVSAKQRPIETNKNLQNSSSKSNLGSLALRENSGQKNFTGKDQRNISPYAKCNSGLKLSANASSADSFHASASAKAKRQIFFDS